VIVEIEQVGPRFDVFPSFRKFADGLGEKGDRFRVAVRSASLHKIAPLFDLPRRVFVYRSGIDPFEDFAIAFACGELFAQRGGVEAEVVEDVLIVRGVVIIFSVDAGDGRAAFVEHARQKRVAAEPAAPAAGWTKSEIRSGDGRGVSQDVGMV
jgi:hypothetical protein